MAMKLGRRFSPKNLTFLIVIVFVFIIINYGSNFNQNRSQILPILSIKKDAFIDTTLNTNLITEQSSDASTNCQVLKPSSANIDTFDVFQHFDFEPNWLRSREYWNSKFEEEFKQSQNIPKKYPLKVILMLHSHNDPGWLRTFEDYFNNDSRNIISNAVTKLNQYKNLTFIWTEIAFLNRWWDQSHPTKRHELKKLVREGRFEITTGGWVMSDEATTHYFAIIDQLLEGHQWVKNNLEIKPKFGWAIDPFGHSSTLPYLLSEANLEGTVIQRIHYIWKEWLAKNKSGDFYWVPNWESKSKILTHNQPYDIYSIKHSCGPHPQICLNFDFRRIPGEVSESISQNITEHNVKDRSELLLEQFQKTASLFPHNVVLMPIGDDFRYNKIIEFDQQFLNYKKMADFINSHPHLYQNTSIEFGTLKNYFSEIESRSKGIFPSLKGDFFVYSDIFSEGRPAYWSGYYTTRPSYKIFDRELENNLRTTEILYTIALNRIQQVKNEHIARFEKLFEKIILARRHLALFQHHDAITGTSKESVMRDYALKLNDAIRVLYNVQENALQALLYPKLGHLQNVLSIMVERKEFNMQPQKIPIYFHGFINEQLSVVVFNSLVQQSEHLLQLNVIIKNASAKSNLLKNLEIIDASNQLIDFQINPVFENASDQISENQFEINFIANLSPLTISTYYLKIGSKSNDNFARIYCQNSDQFCLSLPKTLFNRKEVLNGDIQLQNDILEAKFDGSSGLLNSIKHVDFDNKRKTIGCKLMFGAYTSASFHSGAYLFMPEPNTLDTEKDILENHRPTKILRIIEGSIFTEIVVKYGTLLKHKTRIYNKKDTTLSNGIYIENEIDYGFSPNYRDQEMYMRVLSDIQNGAPPISYTDANGFHMQKRIKVPKIGIEGNYWPITNVIFIEDDKMRLNLLTDHSQGAAAFQPGVVEVMVDRRMLYQDSRGLNEGVTDNRLTVQRHWLVFEKILNKNAPNSKDNDDSDDEEQLRNFNYVDSKSNRYVSISSNVQYLINLLNYPMNTFVNNNKSKTDNQNNLLQLIKDELPCDTQLVNLRTQNNVDFEQDPMSMAFMILFRNQFDCSVIPSRALTPRSCNQFQSIKLDFLNIGLESIQESSLTGLYGGKYLNQLSDLHIEPMQIKTLNLTFVK